MNFLNIFSNVSKNVIVGLLGDALIHRGSLGIDQRPELILETLEIVGELIGPSGLNLNDKLVYELGPGRTPFLMVAMALAGAKQVVGLDVRNWMDPNYQSRDFIEKVISIIRQKGAESFRAALDVSDQSMLRNLKRINSASPLRYSVLSGDGIPEAADSVDFIYSKSVLEHIRRTQVESTMTDHYRVLKPGAFALHIIDLRDHLHINGDHQVNGDWLDALRYPEWLHIAMTSNRRAYINRLRASDWRKLFANQGFELVRWRPRHTPLPEVFDIERLDRKFRHSDEDFSISWVEVLLQKPSR